MRKIINKAFSKKVMASFLLASVVLSTPVLDAQAAKKKDMQTATENAYTVTKKVPYNHAQTNSISVQGMKLKAYEPKWLTDYQKRRIAAAPGSGYKYSYDPVNLKQNKDVMYKTSYGETCMGLKEQKVRIENFKRESLGIAAKEADRTYIPQTRIVNGKEETKLVAVPMERMTFDVVVDPRLKAVSPHNVATTIPQLLQAGYPIGKVGVELVDAETGLCLSGSYGADKFKVTFTQMPVKKVYNKAQLRGDTYYNETVKTIIPISIEYPARYRERLCLAVHGYENDYVSAFSSEAAKNYVVEKTNEFRDGKMTYDKSILESKKKDINHLARLSKFK